jgi:hypothetical protein
MIRIDHVGLVGPDVAALQASFERLGFITTPPKLLMQADPKTGERHSLQQLCSHAVLEQGYVELSMLESGDHAHPVAGYVRRHQGLEILAFGSTDIEADAERCRAAGLEPSAVSVATRDVAYGARHGAAQFHWFSLAPQSAPEGLVCFVHNHTPELVFQAEVMGHPNTASAITGATIVSADPARTAGLYRTLLQQEPRGEGEDLHFEWASQRIRITTKHRFVADYPGAGVRKTPCLAAFEVTVRDIASTAGYLTRARVRFQPRTDGGVWVGPRSAGGAALSFTPQPP